MDISWISTNSDYELDLKGSDDETVVSVELPKCNTALKVTFDKIDGIIEFANEEGSTVKRFSTEQPRSAQNVEKMYVSGIFGGLPHFHEV